MAARQACPLRATARVRGRAPESGGPATPDRPQAQPDQPWSVKAFRGRRRLSDSHRPQDCRGLVGAFLRRTRADHPAQRSNPAPNLQLQSDADETHRVNRPGVASI